MPTEKLVRGENLYQSFEKVNKAIDAAGQAEFDANKSKVDADRALSEAESIRTELNTIVVEGDSSVEAAQARVDELGESHPTLKARVDDGFTSVKMQLDGVADELRNKTVIAVTPEEPTDTNVVIWFEVI